MAGRQSLEYLMSNHVTFDVKLGGVFCVIVYA